MSALVLTDIGKWYGELHALKTVNLSVHQGEFICLLGPSGCGKSTLLKIVAGLEWPDQGQVSWDGQSWDDTPTQRRRVGMVFQNYALFPNLTALDNVAFGLETRGKKRESARNKAKKWLERVGLAGYEDRYSHELSGGQQQRVALARALAPEPEILLLDEPLSALDATVRTSLRNEIRRLQQELGITTVFVTHDQTEALAVADRIAVLTDGKIMEIASPDKIYHSPNHLFTAQFVGNSSLLEGVLVSASLSAAVCSGINFQLPELNEYAVDGMDITVVVRSEKVNFSESNKKQNVVKGKIVARYFMGSVDRYTVATNNIGELLVDVPVEDKEKVGA